MLKMEKELLNDDEYKSALLRKHGIIATSNMGPYNPENWPRFYDQCWIPYTDRIYTFSSIRWPRILFNLLIYWELYS
jgi:hypothetical protein